MDPAPSDGTGRPPVADAGDGLRHGRHSCPAQPFSLAAMTAASTHLLRAYQLTPRWTSHPQPVSAQIGGVARAADPCRVDYASRS